MGLAEFGSGRAAESRALMGHLLMAWAVMAGFMVMWATVDYNQKGDVRILIALIGAPMLVGVALIATTIVVWIVSKREDHELAKMQPHVKRAESFNGGRHTLPRHSFADEAADKMLAQRLRSAATSVVSARNEGK